MREDIRLINYQIEVHTVNRVYITSVYEKKGFIKRFNDMDYDRYFWYMFDIKKKILSQEKEVPIFVANKEIFINPKHIEFMEVYKNVNENKTAKEGVYLLDDFPYKTFYQSEKGYLSRLLDIDWF